MARMFRRGDPFRLAVSIAAVAVVTVALRSWLHLASATTAALLFLTIVLTTAATSSLAAAVSVSVVADLFLNYFFMPRTGR